MPIYLCTCSSLYSESPFYPSRFSAGVTSSRNLQSWVRGCPILPGHSFPTESSTVLQNTTCPVTLLLDFKGLGGMDCLFHLCTCSPSHCHEIWYTEDAQWKDEWEGGWTAGWIQMNRQMTETQMELQLKKLSLHRSFNSSLRNGKSNLEKQFQRPGLSKFLKAIWEKHNGTDKQNT